MRKSLIPAIMPALLIMALLAPSASARQIQLNVAMDKPLLLAGEKQTAHVRIGLTGFALEANDKRTPVNVAIVLDKSGSMSGKKIAQAREAAIAAIQRLNADDIVSIITYDSTVNVLVPATRLTDRVMFERKIRQINAGGSTALFAGVSKGAREIRKFLSRNRVNRIILLSDGLANVGPSSPGQLADLGASLIKEGISVTTIGLGLGYNEDLMTQLADTSDGNHAFVQEPEELARIFNLEFGDVLSVVAQEVAVTIRCAPGVRPVRVLGRKADIAGQTATIILNQLYSRQEKYILLETEIPPTAANRTRDIATVEVSYANMATKTTDELTSKVGAAFTASVDKVKEKVNPTVMESVVEQVAARNNRYAVTLRDKGKVKEARDMLLFNHEYLGKYSILLNSSNLERLADVNVEDANNLEGEDYRERRKMMRAEQQRSKNQQTW